MLPEKERFIYFFDRKNMNLSQGRTREVLKYVYNLDSITSHREWVRSNVAAVGYSSSRLIYKNGKHEEEKSEDKERSRRVMFRVVTNAEIQIRKILEG